MTSIGANYRAACRAKSDADFIYKLQIVEEECDESIYWMQLIGDLFNDKNERILTLINELEQVLAITISSIKKVKDRKNKKH